MDPIFTVQSNMRIKLGRHICGNTFQCVVKYEATRNLKVEKSVARFTDQNEAYKYFKRMNQIVHSNILRPESALKVADEYWVIGEPLVPFSATNAWVRPNQFWKFNHHRVIRLGRLIKRTFQQIGLALSEIHCQSIAHGNLTNGIAFGYDGNIRLLNFDSTADLDENFLKEDLKNFKQLIEKAVEECPLPEHYCVPDEVEYFYSLVDYVTALDGVELWNRATWIYNASLFWESDVIQLFFEKLVQISRTMDFNDFVSFLPLDKFNGWQGTIVQNNDEFTEVFLHSFDDDEERKKKKKKRVDTYSCNCGIIPFTRNAIHHAFKHAGLDVVDELLVTFPFLVGALYYELASTEIQDMEITVIQKEGIASTMKEMTISQYLAKEPSIYELAHI